MNTVLHWIVTHWSYVLAPFGLLGMYVTGRKKAWGWMLSSFTQFLWLAFAITTANYGFIPGTLGYLGIYLNNFRKWRTPVTEDTVESRLAAIAQLAGALDDSFLEERRILGRTIEQLALGRITVKTAMEVTGVR